MTPPIDTPVSPTFSVIIPCFNGEATIVRAIDSVLSQSYSVNEIILVDDGSIDATADIVKQYDHRLIYIWQPNQGVSTARNVGVKRATSEWIVFLDADDEFKENRIAAHAAWIAEGANLDFYLGDQEARRADGTLIKRFIDSTVAGRNLIHRDPAATRHILRVGDFEDLIADGYLEIRTISIRRETFMKLGGFPTGLTIGEDLFFFIRLLKVCKAGGVVMESLAVYYIYDSSALRKNPLFAQTEFVRSLELLADQMEGVPRPIIRGWKKKYRSARLSLAYAYLRGGHRVPALRAVLPNRFSQFSLLLLKDLVSIMRG